MNKLKKKTQKKKKNDVASDLLNESIAKKLKICDKNKTKDAIKFLDNATQISSYTGENSAQLQKYDKQPDVDTNETSNVLNEASLHKKLKTNHGVQTKNITSNTPQVDDIETKKANFVIACREVSARSFYNIEEKISIFPMPLCCLDKYACVSKHGKSQPLPYEIHSYERELFYIEFKSKTWLKALDVFHIILKPHKYVRAEMMLDVLEIILNTHEVDEDLAFEEVSVTCIISKCQNIFKLIFETHPPCPKPVRENYRNFLTRSLNIKDHSYSNRGFYESELGIFHYILQRIKSELKCTSDDAIYQIEKLITLTKLDESNENPNYCDFLIYETLERTERINRLMIVLEILVSLLEADLAIWISKYLNNPNHYMKKSTRPLTAWLFWPQDLYTGVVNDNCRQVFSLFVNLVKLKFPTHQINLFSRLTNLIAQTVYLCEITPETLDVYPNIDQHCGTLAFEFYKTISHEEFKDLLNVVKMLQTTFLQYLILVNVLKNVLKSTEETFRILLEEIFTKQLWLQFQTVPINEIEIKSMLGNSSENLKMAKNGLFDLKLCKQFLKQSKSCKPLVYGNLNQSSFTPRNNVLNQSEFLILLCLSIKYYSSIYNISNIQHRCYFLNNKKSSIPSLDLTPEITESNLQGFIIMEKKRSTEEQCAIDYTKKLNLNKKCANEYRLAFKCIQQICAIYSNLKRENPLLSSVLKHIEIFGHL